MLKLLYLLPVIMCAIWYWYLKQHGWGIKQGWKGFGYILGFNFAIAISLWTIMLLTQR
ncbi:hypothetical protein ORJ00_16735 [Rheinheimera baltica]|uniref:hypothetical protein n=1 Tax=Rheinheimera baltica TaxID=67576 RepID=UPI00273CF52D|nr:hypothetical protein [Rheinheimera baltica]MDP5144398.1 hypothetical protein [Rheinheimera baltica]